MATLATTGAVSAWRFLRRHPDYIGTWRKTAECRPCTEGTAFPMREQTEADLEAAGWGLLAWEDPAAEADASPFWADAPALDAEALPGAAAAGVLGTGGARLTGLRLRDGALILRVGRDDEAVQLRLADGDSFDPSCGVVLRLPDAGELPVLLNRARDLLAIATGRGAKGGGGPGVSVSGSFFSPSTAS
ncbi:MAG: hypothetical protein OXN81_02670 [Alphaproteobacteria bacterium]|nr:hypothetical protein [Alphaproteobacteria bacterium]